jgi:endonuclease/exonuclease/phosphatase family metal-dependent hydrolase
MHITIATYNIHACIGADSRFGPERTVQVLQELDADVVALQEVEHHAIDDYDLLDYLAAETGLRAIAGPTLLRETRHYGNALLTRLPILAANRIDLSLPQHEPRGALDVALDWHGQRVQVVATHLGLRPGERRRQIRRLLALFESGCADFSVLLGDLNSGSSGGGRYAGCAGTFRPPRTRAPTPPGFRCSRWTGFGYTRARR